MKGIEHCSACLCLSICFSVFVCLPIPLSLSLFFSLSFCVKYCKQYIRIMIMMYELVNGLDILSYSNVSVLVCLLFPFLSFFFFFLGGG